MSCGGETFNIPVPAIPHQPSDDTMHRHGLSPPPRRRIATRYTPGSTPSSDSGLWVSHRMCCGGRSRSGGSGSGGRSGGSSSGGGSGCADGYADVCGPGGGGLSGGGGIGLDDGRGGLRGGGGSGGGSGSGGGGDGGSGGGIVGSGGGGR